MGKIKEILKKTPLRRLWWKFCKIPVVKKVRKKLGKMRRDRLLFHTLPLAYDAYRNDPIDENKVIILEPRVDKMSNSFQEVYDELKRNYNFDIHVHLLRETFVPREEYIKNCKKMLADAATAKYIFMNEASEVISCVNKRPETVVTQLWHACGAFKKFGLSTADLLFGYNATEMRRHPLYANLTHVAVSSPEIIWAYEEAMDLKEHPGIVKPVGTSRTDVFFRKETVKRAYKNLYRNFPLAKGKKVILYAPTFRGRVRRARTPRKLNIGAFYQAFKDEYVIVMKHHPLARRIPRLPGNLEGIFAYDATETMSIDDLLCVSDICISDYSSLIFEYSLFERPMLFYAFDLEKYFDWRGFYYPYDELTPGPVCSTNEEMIDYIQNIEERFDKQRVIDFKNRFMSACDGHATDRILELTFGQEALEAHRN